MNSKIDDEALVGQPFHELPPEFTQREPQHVNGGMTDSIYIERIRSDLIIDGSKYSNGPLAEGQQTLLILKENRQ